MGNNKSKILIVDDTKLAREALEDLLYNQGYEIESAESGHQAIEIAKKMIPDLILLDVMMPEMDGYEVCTYFRNHKTLSTVPIILVTALDDKDSRLEGIRAGADDFISKPYDREELRLRVKTITKLNRYKRLYEERQEKKEITLLLEKERELNELKSQFVAMASHEFRTPFTAIVSTIDVIVKYAGQFSAEEVKKRLLKIKREILEMTLMMEDLLILGKIDSSKIEFNPEQVDLNAFIQEIISDHLYTLDQARKVTYKFESSPTLQSIDKKWFKHIVINLFTNALKYSSNDSAIEININQQQNERCLEIKDAGIGISEKDLAFLFEPFSRGNNVGETKGTGLGLVIVKKAVDLHSGRIEVESELKKGSTFKVFLPLIKPGNKNANAIKLNNF